MLFNLTWYFHPTQYQHLSVKKSLHSPKNIHIKIISVIFYTLMIPICKTVTKDSIQTKNSRIRRKLVSHFFADAFIVYTIAATYFYPF